MRFRLLGLSLLLLCCLGITSFGPTVYAATDNAAPQVKELNFVFLHGFGSNSSVMQPLMDAVYDKLPSFIADYEKNHPGIKVEANFLNRSYPNDVDINTWANDIAVSIRKYFHTNNLILIGHSMGGKTALYTVAHNIGGVGSGTSAVVTINSPIKPLSSYYFSGGADYWRGAWLIPNNEGVIDSIAYYDSSNDGNWVGTNKHWLALTSSESTPLSKQFDVSGVDPLPRDMDDKIVPISAQYADGADTVYYGEHYHGEFSTNPELTGSLAEYILRYIFGGTIECAVLSDQGSFKHQAGWMPVSNTWNQTTGESELTTGSLTYYNSSFTSWHEWTGVVGDASITGNRSRFQIKAHHLPLISGLVSSGWVDDDIHDSRVCFKVRAAPRTSVRIEWSITGFTETTGVNRDHYEVEIATGTPFTQIDKVYWLGSDAGDFRLQIDSRAEGPLRWFEARWRVYRQESRSRQIIDEMPAVTPDGS